MSKSLASSIFIPSTPGTTAPARNSHRLGCENCCSNSGPRGYIKGRPPTQPRRIMGADVGSDVGAGVGSDVGADGVTYRSFTVTKIVTIAQVMIATRPKIVLACIV